MQKFRNLDIVYLYFLEKTKNPRLSVTDFFQIQNLYQSNDGLRWLINDAFRMGIISRPEIFCNSGLSFEFLEFCKNQLELLRQCRSDPKTTYALALCGHWDFLRVRTGPSDLKFADRVIPTFPSITGTDSLMFDKKGTLEEDRYPHGWDDVDWEVYKIMRDPSISSIDAVRKSKSEGFEIDRRTIKKHFEKLVKDCKTRMNFFPRGYNTYEKILFTFSTEYEAGLHEALGKLDRTSFLWKVKNFLVLILFVEKYCSTVRHFKELEEVGLIRDLTVSIPNRHYSIFEEDFD